MISRTINIKSLSRWGFGLLLFTIMLGLSACDIEDDIPPPSAYEPPEDTEDCFLLFVVPTLSEEGLDFECEGPETFTFFGEKDGTITVNYAENPDNSGINDSKQVVEVVQTAGVETWAGFFFDLSEKVDFSTLSTIKMKVYSPAAGQSVNLKLEDQTDGSISKEIAVETTVANEWEELSFDFSAGDSDKFDRFVLFFDFMGPKDETTTHYFDDISLVEGDGGGGGGEDPVPSGPAPNPGVAPESVIALFSDVYTEVPVDTWRTEWSNATLTDSDISGDAVKVYSELNFVGVETVANQLDVSNMTHFHTDIWTPNVSTLRIKLVDFGPDGAFEGGDDTEHEVVIENPAQAEWVSVDIPLAEMSGLTTRANIAQLIYSADPAGQSTIYLDNVYFYDDAGVLTEPLVAAPTPSQAEANVISLFSGAYTDVMVDTWRTEWSNSDFEDVEIAGDATKKYSNLGFVGIETVMNQIDLSEMTHFHVDVWTPDAELFRIKLVDFGPNGTFEGPGVDDDTEHELSFESPAQGQWISLDIPIADFENMTTRANFAQLIFSGEPFGTFSLFVDNIYFYEEAVQLDAPATAAPTPSLAEADVISLFSDAYTNVPVDTWRTEWSNADFEDVDVAGNATKKYSNLGFVGIETVMNQIDLSEMTHFHVDVWTPDAELFRIKLVDFGPNGTFEGPGVDDDTEHELSFDSPVQGEWISLDIPLNDFVNMTSRGSFSQLIFSGEPFGGFSLFVDNVYFHK